VADDAIAMLRVPRDHAVFAGHFPGMPLVPGVMLLEWALRETARLLATEPHELRIRESKFFSPLRPDEQAELFLSVSGTRCVFKICRAADVLVSGTLEKK
jgi:3-hydroxyacyl-[acyl-carrier-protein] dehydratase